MDLFDAVLAFALTLAALATIVTIAVETALRAWKSEKKVQRELVRSLYRDVIADNALPKGPKRPNNNAPPTLNEVVNKVLVYAFLPKEMGEGSTNIADVFPQLNNGPLNKMYKEISLEHFLRRLIELGVIDINDAANGWQKRLKARLNKISLKYDEYRSAYAARSKSKKQMNSIYLGVALAAMMNVDGVRLFQSYLDNPGQAATVIAELRADIEALEGVGPEDPELVPEVMPENDPESTPDGVVANNSESTLEAAKTAPGPQRVVPGVVGAPAPRTAGSSSNDTEKKGSSLDETNKNEDGESAPKLGETPSDDSKKSDDVAEALEGLTAQLATVGRLKLPIGNNYFPYCRLFAGEGELDVPPDPLCPKDGSHGFRWPLSEGFGELALWIVKVLMTGLLIGLGAPFWYDFAKRVAEIRSVFGGAGSAEARHSGSDPGVDSEDRTKLIERIVEEAELERA